MAVSFIGGPLDGLHIDRKDGIPAPTAWAVSYPCGCLEFTDDVLQPSPKKLHRALGASSYYPLDEERTTPITCVYSIPPFDSGIDALPQMLDVPEPLVTAPTDASDHPEVVAGTRWRIRSFVAGSSITMPTVTHV